MRNSHFSWVNKKKGVWESGVHAQTNAVVIILLLLTIIIVMMIIIFLFSPDPLVEK